MITAEKRDEQLEFLATTDESYALAKSCMVGYEKQERTVLGMSVLESKEKTVQLKEAEARISKSYRTWKTAYQDSVYDYEILRNKRTTAALIIELWRSEFSALKQGIVF